MEIYILSAFRANAVAEFGFRMIPDVGFDLIPISLVVPDFLARCTDGKEAA